jgi:hypothetical protein
MHREVITPLYRSLAHPLHLTSTVEGRIGQRVRQRVFFSPNMDYELILHRSRNQTKAMTQQIKGPPQVLHIPRAIRGHTTVALTHQGFAIRDESTLEPAVTTDLKKPAKILKFMRDAQEPSQ